MGRLFVDVFIITVLNPATKINGNTISITNGIENSLPLRFYQWITSKMSLDDLTFTFENGKYSVGNPSKTFAVLIIGLVQLVLIVVFVLFLSKKDVSIFFQPCFTMALLGCTLLNLVTGSAGLLLTVFEIITLSTSLYVVIFNAVFLIGLALLALQLVIAIIKKRGKGVFLVFTQCFIAGVISSFVTIVSFLGVILLIGLFGLIIGTAFLGGKRNRL